MNDLTSLQIRSLARTRTGTAQGAGLNGLAPTSHQQPLPSLPAKRSQQNNIPFQTKSQLNWREPQSPNVYVTWRIWSAQVQSGDHSTKLLSMMNVKTLIDLCGFPLRWVTWVKQIGFIYVLYVSLVSSCFQLQFFIKSLWQKVFIKNIYPAGIHVWTVHESRDQQMNIYLTFFSILF